MVSAHFNLPWQSTLVLPPSSISMANNYGFRGSGASKERWCCGTHFPGVFLECAASLGKPFCINSRRRPTILHLFHDSESHSFQPRPSAAGLQRHCPAEKLQTFPRTLIFFSFFLSFPTPSLLFNTNWGSQAENELCVEVSTDKREKADRV